MASLILSWKDALEISETQLVEEAIRNLIDSASEDNAVCLVQKICNEFSNRVSLVEQFENEIPTLNFNWVAETNPFNEKQREKVEFSEHKATVYYTYDCRWAVIVDYVGLYFDTKELAKGHAERTIIKKLMAKAEAADKFRELIMSIKNKS